MTTIFVLLFLGALVPLATGWWLWRLEEREAERGGLDVDGAIRRRKAGR